MSRSKSNRNARLRKEHIPTIQAFCEDLGIEYHYINGYEWHIRIGGVMDVFPTNNRYHLFKTNQRGTFEDYEDLGRIFEEYAKTEEFSW